MNINTNNKNIFYEATEQSEKQKHSHKKKNEEKINNTSKFDG